MPPATDLTIFIVDDDPGIRDALSLMLSLQGYRTACFASAEDFLLRVNDDDRGCLLLDIRMPGMSGLDLLTALRERRWQVPVIMLTAHGDAASARQAFKAEVLDFLEKPLNYELLMAGIEQAVGRERERLVSQTASGEQAVRLATLTPREEEVMQLVVGGHHNKEIARRLEISPRTVEVYKARMMSKLGVRRLSELIRLVSRQS